MSVSITACAFCLKNFSKNFEKVVDKHIYIYDIITLEKNKNFYKKKKKTIDKNNVSML